MKRRGAVHHIGDRIEVVTALNHVRLIVVRWQSTPRAVREPKVLQQTACKLVR